MRGNPGEDPERRRKKKTNKVQKEKKEALPTISETRGVPSVEEKRQEREGGKRTITDRGKERDLQPQGESQLREGRGTISSARDPKGSPLMLGTRA